MTEGFLTNNLDAGAEVAAFILAIIVIRFVIKTIVGVEDQLNNKPE
jgi:hypothetical protein